MNTATSSSPPKPPELHAADQRLVTAQAFRRFVERVSLCAGRWLTYWGVPTVDRDDVFQDALLRMYQQRNLYDPALGCWESWAFSYVGGVVRNYRSRKANRIKREDTALDVLPDMASNAPSPEEDTEAAMMQALIDTCMANLDDDSRAILHASADAGAAEQTDADAGVRAAGRDDTAGEQSLFDLGSTAFQSGYYENAIKVLREHANEYPRSPYRAGRERLFTLALIRAGRKLEARQRIERLRQADPGSALLAEFDVAMSANGP